MYLHTSVSGCHLIPQESGVGKLRWNQTPMDCIGVSIPLLTICRSGSCSSWTCIGHVHPTPPLPPAPRSHMHTGPLVITILSSRWLDRIDNFKIKKTKNIFLTLCFYHSKNECTQATRLYNLLRYLVDTCGQFLCK